jgi:hypothetical protein
VVPLATERVPFLPLPLQTIHIQGDWHADYPWHPSENGIRGIAVQGYIVTVHQQVQRGKKCMGERVEVFVPNRGHVFKIDAEELGRTVPVPAVHRYPVTASYETTR